jgi:K+-sensing histidine kinase KdpD
LINDLLSLNQLRVAVLQSEMLPFDLRLALYDALAPLHPLLDKRGQDLALALDEPLPVEGDARQLEQALLNVLYAVHTAAPLRARLAVRGWDTAAEVCLAISAPGTDEFAAKNEGLGITVARGIIDLHGGQLMTESAVEPTPQLTYTITLPRSRTPLATLEATTTIMEDRDGTEVADRGR